MQKAGCASLSRPTALSQLRKEMRTLRHDTRLSAQRIARREITPDLEMIHDRLRHTEMLLTSDDEKCLDNVEMALAECRHFLLPIIHGRADEGMRNKEMLFNCKNVWKCWNMSSLNVGACLQRKNDRFSSRSQVQLGNEMKRDAFPNRTGLPLIRKNQEGLGWASFSNRSREWPIRPSRLTS